MQKAVRKDFRNAVRNNDTMNYSILGPDFVEDTAKCVTDVFLSDEPMLAALHVNPAAYLPYARFYCSHFASRGLSIIARDGVHLAGFILCHDLAFDSLKAMEQEMPAIDPHTMDLLCTDGALLDDLHKKAELQKDAETLHLVQMGVARPFRGRGIAAALIERALEQGMKEGFHRAVSECSGNASFRCHQKHGFTPLSSITYRTYQHNGSFPFRDLPGECTLMIKAFHDNPGCRS